MWKNKQEEKLGRALMNLFLMLLMNCQTLFSKDYKLKLL